MCVGGGVGSVLVNMMHSQRGGLATCSLCCHVGVQVLWLRDRMVSERKPLYRLENTNLSKPATWLGG